jgi:hypothetical protein
VVSGTIDMVPDVVAVHYPEKTVECAAPAVKLGSLIATTVPKRTVVLEEAAPPATIRQRIAAANDQAEEAPAAEEKKGFFARMFGR